MAYRRPPQIAFAVLLVTLLLGLIQYLPVTSSARYQRVLIDLGHVPLFAGVAVGVLYLVFATSRSGRSLTARYVAAIALTLLLALGSEALQSLDPDRSVSLGDLFRNTIGTVLGVIFFRLHGGTLADSPPSSVRRGLVALGLISIAAALLPPAWTAAAYIHRNASWPGVIGQRYGLERQFAAAYESELEIVSGRALLLRLVECRGCGILLQELAEDWAGLSQLCFELESPGTDPLELSVRLGEAPRFFRSSDVVTAPVTVPPNAPTTRCVALAEFRPASPSSRRPDAFASAAVLADAFYRDREVLIYRIWFE